MNILYYTFLISSILTFLINPGIPGRKYHINDYKTLKTSKYSKCIICNIIVPKEFNLGHCSECNICIIKYDHHCKWSGKCIGKGNFLFFYLFVVSGIGYFIIFQILIIIELFIEK